MRLRPGAAMLCLALLVLMGGTYPAGSTNAVLSVVHDGFAEVTRWWPGNPRDVDVYPWTLYWWNSCLPGDGAIMMLITAPVDIPPAWALTSSYYDPATVASRVLAAMRAPLMRTAASTSVEHVREALRRMTIPGQLEYEVLKGAAPEIRSMDVYEKYGYAVFLFIKWEWSFPPGCKTTIESIPEGYGIPYVR